jgi:hypothetical protein
MSPSRSAAALLLFLGLAIVHTWPLATDPAVLSRNDNGDTILIEWTLAWDAHQVVRAPWNLFEANIFYPSHDTLAFSEHLFALGMMGAPLLWLGLSPVLVYNLLVIAGLALSGWSLCLVVRRWTGDWIAGILAGSIVAFNAHTLTRLPHLHALHYEFLPPALLVLDALLGEPRLKHGLLLAMWFLLTALTSNYQMVFALAALGAALVVRPAEWRARGVRILRPLGLAAVVSAIVMVPFLLPYVRVRELYGAERTLDMAGLYVASINDYLATASRLHYAWWSEPFVRASDTSLFPGVIPIVLGLTAIGVDVAFRDARARMALAIGTAGFLLSLGPMLPGYSVLYRIVPLLQGIRGVNRFGFLVILALAIVSGVVVAHLRRRASGATWMTAAAVLLVVGVNVEALRAPMGYVRFEGIPSVYDDLAREQGAIVAELPFYGPRESWEGAAYMLYSTRHWHPIVNGHSAFIPPSYRELYEALKTFPDAASLGALRRSNVTHVVIHHRKFGPTPDEIDGLRLVARRDNISLYRVLSP